MSDLQERPPFGVSPRELTAQLGAIVGAVGAVLGRHAIACELDFATRGHALAGVPAEVHLRGTSGDHRTKFRLYAVPGDRPGRDGPTQCDLVSTHRGVQRGKWLERMNRHGGIQLKQGHSLHDGPLRIIGKRPASAAAMATLAHRVGDEAAPLRQSPGLWLPEGTSTDNHVRITTTGLIPVVATVLSHMGAALSGTGEYPPGAQLGTQARVNMESSGRIYDTNQSLTIRSVNPSTSSMTFDMYWHPDDASAPVPRMVVAASLQTQSTATGDYVMQRDWLCQEGDTTYVRRQQQVNCGQRQQLTSYVAPPDIIERMAQQAIQMEALLPVGLHQ